MILQHGALAIDAFQEQPRQAARKFVGDFIDGDAFSGTGRILDFKIVAVVMVKLLQALDEEVVHWHPNRPTPVRVATKETGIRLRRLVAYAHGVAMGVELVGM